MTATKARERAGRTKGTVRFAAGDGVVAFVEESHSLPLVSIVVSLCSGSAHDPAGKEGLMRLAARMLRRGCAGLVSREIDDAIDQLGAEMSVDVSASQVTVHTQVIRRNLEPFVALLRRLLSTPTFDEEELARMKRETIAELIEARDSDRSLCHAAFRREVFAGHLYARPAAGTTISVATVTTADARATYERHFARKNIVLGFAGDITPDEARVIARELTCALPEGESVPDPATAPVLPPGRRLVFVDKPERTQTQILIGTLGTSPHDPDHVAIGVACAIFGGTFTSRLMREVRSKRGWSYGASARLAVDRQRQAFSMWTFPAATDAPACIKLELDLLEALVTTGVTARETAFIRRYLMRSHAFDIDTAPKRLAQAMDVELLGLPADYYTGYVDAVSKITEVEANAAIKARLSTANLRVVVVGTASSLLDGVRAAIPGLLGESVVPFDKE